MTGIAKVNRENKFYSEMNIPSKITTLTNWIMLIIQKMDFIKL